MCRASRRAAAVGVDGPYGRWLSGLAHDELAEVLRRVSDGWIVNVSAVNTSYRGLLKARAEAVRRLTRMPFAVPSEDLKDMIIYEPPFKLTLRDVELLARLCAEGALSTILILSLARKNLCDDGLDSLCAAVETGALAQLGELVLDNNSVRDDGFGRLARAGARGFASLRFLDVNANRIGAAGMTEFAAACASGAFPLLRTLSLNDNRVGDAGLKALAACLASGRLLHLYTLNLGRNDIGDAGLTALTTALIPADRPIARLYRLSLGNYDVDRKSHLFRNSIGDAGAKALVEARSAGALDALGQLDLRNNDIGDAGRGLLTTPSSDRVQLSAQLSFFRV